MLVFFALLRKVLNKVDLGFGLLSFCSFMAINPASKKVVSGLSDAVYVPKNCPK